MTESAIDSQHCVISQRDAYRAAFKGELDTLLKFYQTQPTSPINLSGDTVLHVLTLNRNTMLVCELLKLDTNVLTTQNHKGNTALHEAAMVGSVKIAELMVQKDENLVCARNLLGETSLYRAAAFGQKEVLHFLSKRTGDRYVLTRDDGSTILHAAMMGEFYALALEIVKSYPDLAIARNERGLTALHLLAQSPSSFRTGSTYSLTNLGSSTFIPLQMLEIIIYSYWQEEGSEEPVVEPEA